MKRILLIVLLVAIAVGGGFALNYVRGRPEAEGSAIRVSGNIEATEVQLSFRIAGWVARRQIDEGQTVAAGQLAAELDATELTQQVDQQKSAVAVAKAALAELEAGSRPEEIAAAEAATQRAKAMLDELLAGSRSEDIAAASAVVDRAKAEVAFADADYKRMQETVKTGAVGQTQFDNARTAYEASQARLAEADEKLKLLKAGPRKEQIEQARAALAESQQRTALVKKGPRQETIDQARARLGEAEQALAIAQTRLSYAKLTCPVGGVVLSKNVEAGEFVAAGTPIVTIGNLKDIWLRAYVVGTDLGKVKLGQKVRVKTDSYPDKVYDGRVSFIAAEAEFTPKNVQTNKERVKLVYRIKIDIDNPNMELKPGMPADAEIVVGQ
jgi:HlyD family secretion protein